jgi:hypothetical protein
MSRGKRLIDKLGVKPNSKITVLGVKDEKFWKQLKESVADITSARIEKSQIQSSFQRRIKQI